MGFVNERNVIDGSRTVDYERNITLKMGERGLPGQWPSCFTLQWHNQQIRINADLGPSKLVTVATEALPAKFIISWEITAIEVPPNFPESREKLCEVICEALSVFGTMNKTDNTHSVEVSFAKNVFEGKVSGDF